MASMQGKLPLILSASFTALIIGGAVHRLSGADEMLKIFGGTLIFLYLSWIVIEARVAFKEVEKSDTKQDKGTLELYALGRMLTVMASLFVPPLYTHGTLYYFICLLLFLVGIGYRLHAISVLGKFYSHRVRLTDEHQIISHGPYSLLRHPAYTGMILGHLGVVLMFLNWANALIYACFFVPAIVFRILIEEKALFSLPGYPEYAATRKRIIPFVW